jgi:cyclic pyranopterin phosphate synthase
VVVLNGINDHELTDLAKLSFAYPFHIRFIEYMPIGQALNPDRNPLLCPQIKSRIQQLGELIPVKKGVNDGPAIRYRFRDAAGEIGFISPVSHHFCNTCNRLRLTADGRIRACLLSDISEDIKTPLRSGLLDADLADIFIKVVMRKPRHHPESICLATRTDKMVSIGG